MSATVNAKPMAHVLNNIRQLVAAHRGDLLTDRQLLKRFVALRDEAAFAQIVRRHGPMLLKVCHRVLGNWHDAEDAVQAVLLILARKAPSVSWQDSIAGWLFRVAYRLASKMKSNLENKRAQSLPDVAQPIRQNEQPDWELHQILNEELSGLPDKYRTALLLCYREGKTRAEAASLLSCKEGTVKIRLERGRTLLRARLLRRGLAPAGALAASLPLQQAAAALPPALLNKLVASAMSFAAGQLFIMNDSRAAALATGVLKTMTITRLQWVALLVLAISLVCLSAGLGAYRVFAQTAPEIDLATAEIAVEQPPLQPQLAKPPGKPLRVLLFAGAPNREYQFVRSLFGALTENKHAELSIYLQSGKPETVQDVPPDRLLKQFPTRLAAADSKDEDPSGNLMNYDVLIAFDPDWTKLTEAQAQLLERWIGRQGRGLILAAGPVHTWELSRAVNAHKLKPILDMLPVILEDQSVVPQRDSHKPWALQFPSPDTFLQLDEQGDHPLAGWSEFFFDRQRDDWQKTDDLPVRGFYTAYPVKQAKPAATVVATFRDPRTRIPVADGKPLDLPYLVTMSYGQGKTIYLGSAETWRLRQCSTKFHERFWMQLTRYASSAGAVEGRNPVGRAPMVAPLRRGEQQAMTDRALRWLVNQQYRDGHWAAHDGQDSTALTALAGQAVMMQGSDAHAGEYAVPIRKAVEWLIAQSRRDGLIGNMDDPGQSGRYMFGHSYAQLFLAQVYGKERDADRKRKLADVLTQSVRFSAKAQTSRGGWGYIAAADGGDFDHNPNTVVQVQALRAIRYAGVPVPKEVLDKADDCLKRSTTERGGVLYSLANADGTDGRPPITAAALAAWTADYNSDLPKRWLAYCLATLPSPHLNASRLGHDEFTTYYFGQVVYRLGENGYGRLFPDAQPGQRLTWSAYRKGLNDFLQSKQQEDGSWILGSMGPVYSTACYLTILQLDREALAFYRR